MIKDIKKKLPQSRRSPLLDQIRGFSVVLMIIFHLSYDLNIFQLVNIDFLKNPYWYIFPRIIVLLFFFCVGISLGISHRPAIRWKPLGQRLLKLCGLAILISAATFYLFPQRWIYFGTLHSIALCSIMALPLIPYPNLSLIIGLGLMLPSAILRFDLPWILLPHPSMDYISPFPWVGAVLLGLFAQHQQLERVMTKSNHFLLQLLEITGKHALIIYLIHQPLLYSIAWFIRQAIPYR
ncbi:MAG: DUF1624 domain-containing protein [Bdellovibrionales bacterium]|jgi:uncharacterized membrane protein|nr:DUF1624 domain-containing protein [Bdellovibrionales bacterium]MBT3525633.1 DUF1624 domain-containing protein [Bdellovibrionales bacterium]MBT7767309.1 DUF1624 domain-containing protein [Bdellovibrionales bacterium]